MRPLKMHKFVSFNISWTKVHGTKSYWIMRETCMVSSDIMALTLTYPIVCLCRIVKSVWKAIKILGLKVFGFCNRSIVLVLRNEDVKLTCKNIISKSCSFFERLCIRMKKNHYLKNTIWEMFVHELFLRLTMNLLNPFLLPNLSTTVYIL